MPYLIGVVLSLGVAAFARVVGFDRDRAFYATVLLVIASYYVLFGAMAGSLQAVLVEAAVMAAFAAVAVAGFKRSVWILVIGLAGHGIFDALHGLVLHNPGVPGWWPAFCGAYDVTAAAYLALRLSKVSWAPRAEAGAH
jgi:hypothetical protein